MATSQKKNNSRASASRPSSRGGARSASGSGRSRSSAGRTGSSRRKSAPETRPIRREVGALVCVLLAIFASFGYFHIDAVFIVFFCNLLKGLFGYGFYLAPPMLLIAAGILMFHRGRPVARRLVAALCFVPLLGGLLHVVITGNAYPIGFKQIAPLWKSGLAVTSGGVVSGGLAVLLSKIFSRIGAALVFLILMFVCNMILTRITPVDIVDGIKAFIQRVRGYMQNRPEYVEEEEEESFREEPARVRRVEKGGRRQEEPYPSEAPREPVRRSYDIPPTRSQRRESIDIPLDDEEAQVFRTDSKKKHRLFDKKPGAQPPHTLLEAEGDVPADADWQDDRAAEAEAQEPQPVPAPAPVPPVKEAPAQPKATEKTSEKAIQPPEKIPEDIPAVQKVEAGGYTEKLAKSQAANSVARARMGKDSDVYQYPPVYLLDKSTSVSSNAAAADELQRTREMLDDTLQSFGIDARIVNVTRGPSVTRYELELMRGVKLNKLTNLAGDVALSLGASSVRIAPIPGRSSVVGVEVPNQLVTPVPIRDVLDSREFRMHTSKVAFALGKDISGKNVIGNIAKLPHLLIAGTTGSGKSVCTNSLIISLLYKSSPEDVRLIMVDPKMVELGIYNGIPHLLIPVVTDPKKAAGALQWAVTEMMKRYRAFSEEGVRDLDSYNAKIMPRGEKKVPQVVVVIDELADLMLVAAKEVEESICRVAQMGRAAGMHLVIATQRPSADVITGLMKANIPSRIAFAVASAMESRIILDTQGAEKLVGKGDMLYAPLGAGKPQRVQGCMITDEEVSKVVDFIKQTSQTNYDETVRLEVETNAKNAEKGGKGGAGAPQEDQSSEADELLPSAIEVVVETGMASVSMLQRRLKLGYSRAARLVDQMEERGIVGPFEGSKPRQVLISKEEWQQAKMKHTGSTELPPVDIEEDEFAVALAMSEAADAEADLRPDEPSGGME